MTTKTGRTVAGGIALIATLAVTVFFAGLAIEHGLSLYRDGPELEAVVNALLTSPSFIFGEGSIRYANEHYPVEALKMAFHMTLGGTALGLGALQFIPGMRRRFPRLHRFGGVAVWVTTTVSMIGAMAYLTVTPMTATASGPGFWLALWALALLTLGLLSQAIITVFARDFRSHMVWMALVFAALGTAPMLRLDWVVFHYLLPLDHEHINLAVTGFVLLQTIAVMAWWLATFGAQELPPRKVAPTTDRAPALLIVAAVAAGLVLLHEGLLAPYGLDALGDLRDASDRLTPLGGALASLPTFAALALLPRASRAVMGGERLPLPFTLVGLLAAVGWIVAGATMTGDTLARVGVAACWIGTGGFVLLALVAATVSRADGSARGWAWIGAATLLTPAVWPAALAPGLLVGASFAESSYGALIVASSLTAAGGVVVGFGARVFAPSRALQSIRRRRDDWLRSRRLRSPRPHPQPGTIYGSATTHSAASPKL
ncbi:DUF2306 domain-containing protein [Enhygromyxa salina]|uniref:Uncharacterized protein n=1 Tax=Enhygromyxa salina TaxID=215803 RepID=A0A2S9XU32_9BACT|nr:DUF2306 domain-containing protein [Enhygromyxa salina]PRP96376.1 hypothetical protein ENSA7_71910 [Enhygromyxa salina]